MASEEGDLSDFDIHLIMEALSTRQAKVVASCALGIKLLLTEIQQQLLDLMVDGRMTDTPLSHAVSEDGVDGDFELPPDLFEKEDEVELNQEGEEKHTEDDGAMSTVTQDAVVTGATVPITGALIKSPHPYPCSNCTAVFSTKKALSRHVVKDCKNFDANGITDACENSIIPETAEVVPSIQDSDAEAADHEPLKIKLPLPKASSSGSGSRVNCDECGAQTLKQHMARHRLTHSGAKPFACDLCNSAFSRKDKLKEHMKKHLEGNEFIKQAKKVAKSKVSKCRKRDFETADKELFKEHRKTHPAKMVYKCEHCDKEFHCPSHLEQHSIKHRNEKPFMCDMCGVSFSREPNLARHIRSHVNPAPFNCKFCGKPYHRNNELVVHERTHTGEKPYVCEVCGNAYASTKYLKRHLFTHTGLKPFKCDLCERAFARPENMRAHRKLHEKASNRLAPPPPSSTGVSTVTSAFQASRIESAIHDAASDDASSVQQRNSTDMMPYQFPNIASSVAATNSSATSADNILQSFKISDSL